MGRIWRLGRGIVSELNSGASWRRRRAAPSSDVTWCVGNGNICDQIDPTSGGRGWACTQTNALADTLKHNTIHPHISTTEIIHILCTIQEWDIIPERTDTRAHFALQTYAHRVRVSRYAGGIELGLWVAEGGQVSKEYRSTSCTFRSSRQRWLHNRRESFLLYKRASSFLVGLWYDTMQYN